MKDKNCNLYGSLPNDVVLIDNVLPQQLPGYYHGSLLIMATAMDHYLVTLQNYLFET